MNITKQNLGEIIKLTLTTDNGVLERYITTKEEHDTAIAEFEAHTNTDWEAVKKANEEAKTLKIEQINTLSKEIGITSTEVVVESITITKAPVVAEAKVAKKTVKKVTK